LDFPHIQPSVLLAGCNGHVGLSLYDIANEDILPFHLRVFALRLTLWMWTKHSTVSCSVSRHRL
jgi:hypothetical protein